MDMVLTNIQETGWEARAPGLLTRPVWGSLRLYQAEAPSTFVLPSSGEVRLLCLRGEGVLRIEAAPDREILVTGGTMLNAKTPVCLSLTPHPGLSVLVLVDQSQKTLLSPEGPEGPEEIPSDPEVQPDDAPMAQSTTPPPAQNPPSSPPEVAPAIDTGPPPVIRWRFPEGDSSKNFQQP